MEDTKMTNSESILIDAYLKDLVPECKAAIYASCQKLRKFLASKGEELSFEDGFILWRGWIGEPILGMLSNDRKIIALLGNERFSLLYHAIEEMEKNRFVFSQDKMYTLAEKAHLKKVLRDYKNKNKIVA